MNEPCIGNATEAATADNSNNNGDSDGDNGETTS